MEASFPSEAYVSSENTQDLFVEEEEAVCYTALLFVFEHRDSRKHGDLRNRSDAYDQSSSVKKGRETQAQTCSALKSCPQNVACAFLRYDDAEEAELCAPKELCRVLPTRSK